MCAQLSKELFVARDGRLKNNFEKDTDVIGIIYENNTFIYRVKYASKKPKAGKEDNTRK